MMMHAEHDVATYEQHFKPLYKLLVVLATLLECGSSNPFPVTSQVAQNLASRNATFPPLFTLWQSKASTAKLM